MAIGGVGENVAVFSPSPLAGVLVVRGGSKEEAGGDI